MTNGYFLNIEVHTPDDRHLDRQHFKTPPTDPKNLFTYLLRIRSPSLYFSDPRVYRPLRKHHYLTKTADYSIFGRMDRSVFEGQNSTEEKELVSSIESMAQRVRDNVHLYLKFIGD